MAAPLVAPPGDPLATMMSRPQIGIDRLPVRRSGHEPKEAMNCKSCRKRKIKCNRVKPSCEACQVFNCACVYDAVPKKRGPKTDVLEALLKRVNGLERRLEDEKKPEVQNDAEDGEVSQPVQAEREKRGSESSQEHPMPNGKQREERQLRPMYTEPVAQSPQSIAFTDALLDTYFARIHSKPYYILDESNTRQRLRDGQLPNFLINAIHAVSIRFVPHLCGGYTGAVRSSQQYALQSRTGIDVDEPSIDHLQALLLLTMANFQAGKGKKSYMLLSHAISMAFALGLHRELPEELRVAPIEREGRRKLFWTCYLIDRFTTSGSKRPPLISDESICLRFPSWKPPGSRVTVDGNYFPNGSSLPYASGFSIAGQGSGAMLVEIVRILGITNRYLAAGGVKGDSHFPWHAQSTLSRIRSDLDHWAASTQDAFSTLEVLFGQPDSMALVLSKLVYHLVHCLLYRPFLPVDLAELSGTGQHQSWQIEATNLCFMHANAIAELVEIGKSTGILYWPSFVGFCVCTAGTIHVHGVHYMSSQEGEVFSNSGDCLSREMAHLSDFRLIWAGVQHQRETLQIVYTSHSQLVQTLACSPMRFSPVFQMEDFFDRYPGSGIDGAHITFADVAAEDLHESIAPYHDFTKRASLPTSHPQLDLSGFYQPVVPSQYMTQNRIPSVQRKAKRRRTTDGFPSPYPTPSAENQPSPLERRHSEESRLDPPPRLAIHDLQLPPNEIQSAQETQQQQQVLNHLQNPTLSRSAALTPNFSFSPLAPSPNAAATNTTFHDPFYGAQVEDHQTPSGLSLSGGSTHTEQDNDPFLSFLEQLAQNNGSGGPSDLGFFLDAQDSGIGEG